MKQARPLPRPCTCGQTHWISGAAVTRIAEHGDMLPVMTSRGAWYVPYVFGVVHDIRADPLAAAAMQYGFEPLSGTARQ